MKWFVSTLAIVLATAQCDARGEQQPDVTTLANTHGGLVVQLGAADTLEAAKLSRTGRYLIHVLDSDKEQVAAARIRLRSEGHYGLAWAERVEDPKRLPYAENLVNLIVVAGYAPPIDELMRVLTPGGKVVVISPDIISSKQLTSAGFVVSSTAARMMVAKKPWPAAMDVWSHPRHNSDGNAVSQDTLVGPPERVRWVAAATSEVEGLVTSGGRNYYGGLLTRDSFNGLRLWHRDLKKSNEINPDDFELPKLSRDGPRPIASAKLLFAVLQNLPVALDAQNGEVAVEYGDKPNPTAMIHDVDRVIVAYGDSLCAFDEQSGEELWTFAAADPQNVIADGKVVCFIQGNVRRGETPEAVTLDAENGQLKWRREDYPWLARSVRTVLAKGQLVFEVSTLNDHDADNGIHVVSAETGKHVWSKHYPPGMNHARQARAMFLGDDLWILHGGRVNSDDPEKRSYETIQVSALDPLTGKTRITHPAGLTHCFPPVATPNFMFAGELDLTNLKTGEVIANRITKANCSRENGWVPANGLIYTTPKHCTCWPMLRGFVALAPASKKESAADLPVDKIDFVLERGPSSVDHEAVEPVDDHWDWPQYRHDRWRSASTTAPGPTQLENLWNLRLNDEEESGSKPSGPILDDWRDNPIVKGPLSAPTIANGLAFVTRPDAHELIAIDAAGGNIRWRFTANGRLDTPPTIHRGVCLFGTAAGWVYGLRADDGQLVWRMRAAPTDERIVAYGQVESAWPVPGAVLVIDDIAYFAAGRQPLADGGILVFSIDPLTGQRHWVRRIDTVPQKGFYENSGLEFDPFDILHAEGDGLAMSRWVLSADGKDVSVDKWNAFAKLNTGAGEVWVPRGSWTYGARHQHRFRGEASRRPLIAFRDDNIYSSLNGSTIVFRRDFDLEKGEKFDSKWITGWKAAQTGNSGGTPYRTYRIAEKAKWANDPFAATNSAVTEVKPGTQLHNRIHAMALAGDDRLFVVHKDGRLKVISTEDGSVIEQAQVPPPAWDGLAIARRKLYLTTQDGELICLGDPSTK